MHQIINKIRSNSPASDALRKAQMEKNPGKAPLQLILDIEIRWTTLPSMIKRYLDLEKFIYVAMSECNSPIDVLNREEQLILSDVLLITEPIARAIEYISGQNYPTRGLIIPIINGLEKCIQVLEPSSKDGIKFKEKILDSINLRFKDFEFNSVLANATFLDPRYKKDSFRNPMAVIKAQNQINSELIKMVKKPVDDEIDLNLSPIKKTKVPDVWDLDEESRIMEKNRKKAHLDSNAIHPELNQFYQIKRLEREDDPIQFWRNQKEALPTIYPLAMKYAVRSATSVPSERMFSNAGLTKTKIRNRLDPDHLDMIVFLHSCELEDWFSI
ncbi:zinc finger BED domain-containing protein 4-like [Trichogramma pretiosum]|uniref:zinc finger BED domain-containing protein 4-like n=1 Tax=Trichogramma pretiosum TaxID=7493 RepID=UPI0006C94F8A|nr:zinc finger BED domain-containing protein 4-like [Trichogramma pretiosum]